MTLLTYLGIFSWCPHCSLWLILLLLGAWILGWLLWDWTKGSRLRAERDGLHAEINNWKKKFTDTESDLAQARYDREKMSGEFATVKSKLVDADTRYLALEEKYKQLETTNAAPQVDVTQWENHIANMEHQLENSKNTNLKLQEDYTALIGRFTELQLALEAADKSEDTTSNTSAEQLQALEDQQNRIADLEKKLALAYETNSSMEADYANLKANYGDLEMNLVGSPNPDVGDFSEEREKLQNRITELEFMLASSASEGGSLPGEGKKKKKKKDKKKKKKGKSNQENDDDGMQGSSGQILGFAAAFADDNLQIVEGIGPKIEGVLKLEGINTWKELSETSSTRLREILENAGSRYKMHDPSSWAEQAELAAQGDWEKLVNMQKVLGSTDGKESDSKAEKLYFKLIGFANVKPNDLKVIEGIGPKIESLLQEGGIETWKKLAEATPDDIQTILDAAGPRFKLASPGTWPKQAKLAEEGDWNALKVYQDQLKGGKE